MIIKIFLFWRIGLFFITFLGSLALPKIDNGGIGSVGPGRNFDYWASWAQWDGGHYYQIAQQGYIYLSDYAFFPLYPLLVKITSILMLGNLIFAGLLISNISFFLFLRLLYKYIKRKYSHKIAISTIGTYLTFPTTFFATAYYSESLFLLFAILAFYFILSEKTPAFMPGMRRILSEDQRTTAFRPWESISQKRFLLSAVFVSLAGATRLVGFALIVSLFYSYFASLKMNFKRINLKLLHIIPAVFGLTIYCLFLFGKLDDPFKFLTTQALWQRSVTDPISTVFNYLWAFITGQSRPIDDYIDFALTVFFIATLILGIRKISSSLWIFSILVILIPASTGTLTSMPRYLLSSIGAFIIIGKFLEGKPRLKIAVWSISLIAQSILAVRFINGYWVA